MEATATKSTGLTRQQKESVFLLSIGTFLEYFDLMLYIHMAVLLNDLFFPQANPAIAKILGAFAFASTFLFRPIGGFVIGRIGDKLGRKKTVMITTFVMAGCCLTMAALPTYAEIGITASVVMILCRALQGFSSMGEVTGALLYVMESFKQPQRYMFSVFIQMQGYLGAFAALAVASLALSMPTSLGWRLAFMIGAIISVVGLAARTRLRETPEFVDYQRRMKIMGKSKVITLPKIEFPNQNINPKTVFFLFIMYFSSDVSYCMAYIYASDFMTDSLGFSAEQVINQNLCMSIISIIFSLFTLFLLKKYHPTKIATFYAIIIFAYLPFIPFVFGNVNNIFALSLLQFMLLMPNLCGNGVDMVFFRHFPVTKRFVTVATIAGVASLHYAFVPSLFIPLSSYFGHYGLLLLFVPGVIGLLLSINHLKKLEKAKGCYSEYPNVKLQTVTYPAEYKFKNPELYAGYDLECKYSTILLNKIIGTKTIDQRLVEKAMIFCKKWHDGQMRKSGEQYYSHPFTVADMVVEYIPTTDVLIGALLHDVVEDTACTLELIKQEFNARVAQIVERLTRVKTDKDGNQYNISVEDLMGEMRRVDDQEALLIKEIDRLHNLYTIESMSEDKKQHTAGETMEHVIPNVAYAVDNLNLDNKLNLEGNLTNKE